MGKSFTWSYSALKDFETCPAKYKYRREKTPTRKNEYSQRGIEVHEGGEKYLKGEGKLPKEFKLFSKQLKDLRDKLAASAESAVAFTRKWHLTGWWDPDVWLRIKLDVSWITEDVRGDEFAHVVDFKTGKPREYPEQERIYAAATLCRYPEPKRVDVQFWFLDHGIMMPKRPAVYSRANALRGIQQEFTLRAKRMEQAKKFEPRPGGACKFCDYSKRKGGPCKY